MIPQWIELKIPRPAQKPVRLWLPLLPAWLLLAALWIVLSPVWILVSLAGSAGGYGRFLWRIPLLFWNTLWHLGGLRVDVDTREDRIYIQFR